MKNATRSSIRAASSRLLEFLSAIAAVGIIAGTADAAVTSNIFNANNSFTVPAGVTSLTIHSWGGGGASGTAGDNTSGSGGGGGGAFAGRVITVVPNDLLTITVGGGGATNATIGGTGGTGSSTIVTIASTNVVVAVGGAGGTSTTGGTGGTAAASTGETKFNGGNGAANSGNNGGGGGGSATPLAVGSNGSGQTGGAGQAAGSDGAGNNNPGVAGTAPGGGAGGAGKKNGGDAGGAGGTGRVAIMYTLPANQNPTDIALGNNSVAENAGANAVVGALSGTDPDTGESATLTFSLPSGVNDNNSFNISGNNLRLNASANFESKSSYTVTVRASDTGSPTGTFDKQFTINVTDVNEFSVGAVTDSNAGANTVAENAANGTTVGVTASASDADGSNNTITYSLTDNAGGRFTIGSSSGIVTVLDGSLLNYENATSHSITVKATSADTSFSSQSFTINVTDVDEFDVGAVTDSNAGANTVAENAANGTTVGVTASASDADGSNNTITYSLTDNAGGRFTIGSSSGIVTVLDGSLLNYENATSHSITVKATSSDTSFSTQSFTINVTDVDEFDVGAVTDSNAGANTVAENAANGTTVGVTASASDADGSNNTITYSLTDDAGGRFTIGSSSGIVTVLDGSLLNYENATSHSITVKATSSDTSFSTQSFTINVTDVDEFDVGAVTDANAGANTVAENASNGTTVGVTASASDADGSNNTITYSLTDDAGGRFTIGSSSGIVTVLDGSLLNYENATSHSITVKATSSDTSFSTQSFTINVTDVDEFDVGAVTDANAGANTVAENASNGTTVGVTASASDADGSNNTITYSLTDDAGGRFTIGSSSGIVTVLDGSLLNYENATSHSITVKATSSDTSFSTQSFTINVTDVDEFDVGSVTDANAGANTVAENASNGTTVGVTASASDADGSNNTITYSLTDDAGGRFTIGSSSGIVTVLDGSLLNYENATSHSITVKATSSDTSFSSQSFTINVTDVDEFDVGAVTDSNAGANTVAENASNGTTVGVTASASDADGSNNTITYSLTDDAGGRFTIGSSSGIVTVLDGSLLNYENATSHSITVKATSSDTSFSTQSFTINVTDVDEFDVGAVTDSNAGANTVAENAANGTTVGVTASASDADGSNNTITYSLTDDAGGRFTIGSSSGIVTVLDGSLLDYENATSHSITVKATSSDTSFSTQSFTINVTDVNENLDYGDAPSAAQSGFAASYPTLLADDGARHMANGPTLGANRDVEGDGQPTVGADGDDTNGTPDDEDGVTFSTLLGGGNSTFTVNVQGGTAKLNAWIDFNQNGSWNDAGEQIATNLDMAIGDNLVVVSIPLSAAAGTTYARFRLSTDVDLLPTGVATDGEVEDYAVVIDVNDAPTDLQLTGGTVVEQQLIGTAVGTFVTTDPDLPNDSHTYALVGGTGSEDNAYFKISSDQLQTKSNLVYATKSTFRIRARTTDSGGLTFEQAFTIFVIPTTPAPPPPKFTNDFDSTTNGWIRFPGYELTLDGLGHGQLAPGSPAAPSKGATDWGTYDNAQAYGSGFTTTLDINLNTNTDDGLKFAYLVAVNLTNKTAAAFEFAFLVQRVPVSGAPGFRINTAMGAPGAFENPDGTTIAPLDDAYDITVTNGGWYTFQHWFHATTNAGVPYLTVELTLIDANTNVVASWVIDTGKVIGVEVAGSRYGKIVGNEFAALLVDNSRLTVIPKPVALATGATLLEDSSVDVRLAGTVFPASVTPQFKVLTGPAHGSLNAPIGNYFSNPMVNYTPDADYNGLDSFTFLVSNGAQDSASVIVKYTITSVNDAPTFAILASLSGGVTVVEDSTTTTLQAVDTATVSKGAANESVQTLAYQASSDNAALFLTQPTVSSVGALTFRPAANKSGDATVTIVAKDNGGTANGGLDTSLPHFVAIHVSPSNDAPVLGLISTVTVPEGLTSTPDVLVPLTLSDLETPLAGMSVGVVVVSQTGGIVVGPAAEFFAGAWRVRAPILAEASGSATLRVTATDTGEGASPARSVIQTFTLTVTAVNDAPDFTLTSSSVAGLAGVTITVPSFASFRPNGAKPGDTFEAAQVATYTITLSASDKLKFTTQPAISAAGTLTYKYAAGATGPIIGVVKVSDNGGTSGGGVNVSGTQNLTFNPGP